MVCSEMLLFLPPPCAILTDMLARTQLMELQGKATGIDGPHIA